MAASRLMAPVGIASTRILFSEPSRMIEPLPQVFSICAIARFSAFFLSSAIVDTAISSSTLLVERSALWPGWLTATCSLPRDRDTRRKYERARGLSRSRCKAECVFYVADPNLGAIQEHADHVETIGFRFPPVAIDPNHGRALQLLALPMVDGL